MANLVQPATLRKGFTLVELMVSIAVLSILLLVAVSILDAVQNFSAKSNTRTEQLRSGRQALDGISLRLSQAVLNPYWAVEKNAQNRPVRFARLSDLRFLSGPSSQLLTNIISIPGPGGAFFFQAPTGFASNGEVQLNGALNTWGYFIEYGSDSNFRPPFLTNLGVPEKYRFRLMEFLDPSDQLNIFNYTSGNQTYNGRQWYQVPLGNQPANRRVLAENVVAMVALPRLSSLEDSGGTDLAPNYVYDTTASNSNKEINPKNQLPPVVEIALVVIDERSASRINWTSTPPDFGQSTLFQDASRLEQDLETLRANIETTGATARIFRTIVTIASARWSTEQAN